MTNFNMSDWALRHKSLVWFFSAIVLVAGLSAYLGLGRNEDPTFTIKTMVIELRWPGASVDDMLDQVADRVERKLQETPYLDYVKSYTVPGRTTIFVNLLGSAPSDQVPGVWYQVRKKLDDIRHTLPSGISGPFFNDEFGDTYGIIHAFTADGFTFRELRDYVETVRTELLGVEDVSKIDIFGVQDEKIYLEFSPQKLAQMGLDRSALLNALAQQNAVAPAGTLSSPVDQVLVQVSGGFDSEADLLDVNFLVDGKMMRLGDLATVRRTTSDPAQPMVRINGVPALALGIAMKAGGDVLQLGEAVEAKMASLVSTLPVGIEAHIVAEQPKVVEQAIDEFMHALWEAVAIVLAVSLLSLGLRAGAVVTVSIPLVLGATFLTMQLMEIDLQRVSLGALIIALGLLVDDAMITVESMISKLEEGWDKAKAATFAYTSTAFPMLSGTLVTAAGFIPIGFAQSSAGEYSYSLFAVVVIALCLSWVVAVAVAPLLGVAMLPAKVAAKHHGEPSRFMRAFRCTVEMAMRAKWVTIGGAIGLLVLAMAGFKLIPNQFFPASDRPELLVELSLPQASSILATDTAARKIDALLSDDPDVARWTSYIGQGSVRFYLPLNVQLPNNAYTQTVVVAKDAEARDRLAAKLKAAVAVEIPEAVARISPLEMGPPVGWPLQYRVTGPDPSTVQSIAQKTATLIAGDARVFGVNYDWMTPQRTVKVVIDQNAARLVGLSSQSVAQFLNAVMAGTTVTQIRDGIYLVDVVARAGAPERLSLESLRSLRVPTPGGHGVPITQIATIENGLDWPLVWRRDRQPTLTVQADVVAGSHAASIAETLSPRIAALNEGLPEGYSVTIGGSVEESANSSASVNAVLPVAGLVMVIVLMIQLQSVSRLLLVLSVAPFGLIGVVMALLASGRPLGFIATLGIIALVGMIIRNSVILIDQIEVEIRNGHTAWDAVLDATCHRFRPILLTAAAAILGMAPIAGSVFWGPMAFAIMGGLAVATAITLVFLPALYVAWFAVKPPALAPAVSAPSTAVTA